MLTAIGPPPPPQPQLFSTVYITAVYVGQSSKNTLSIVISVTIKAVGRRAHSKLCFPTVSLEILATPGYVEIR